MADVAVDHEIYRLSAEQYHLLIESGGFDEKSHVELIDGLLLDMSPRSPEHENIVGWLLRRLFTEVNLERYEIRVRAALSLGDSEPEPDIFVFANHTRTPYHPATAALVIEVAVSSQQRDLRVKPRLYAGADAPVYWVIDVARGRALQHSDPQDDEYGLVEIVTELTAPHLGVTVSVADVLAASAR